MGTYVLGACSQSGFGALDTFTVCLVSARRNIKCQRFKRGAFSGCAVALDDRIQFYLTRHLGPSEDCDETVQYQTMVSSRDGINFGKEEIIIEKPGKPFSFNFRDPKVFYHNEKWKMVLGTQLNNIPAIVLYESKDMRNFEYSGR